MGNETPRIDLTYLFAYEGENDKQVECPHCLGLNTSFPVWSNMRGVKPTRVMIHCYDCKQETIGKVTFPKTKKPKTTKEREREALPFRWRNPCSYP